MAIKKFLSIKRVGRFTNSAAAGDVELKRFNLIFAENGRGKTTLCAILRSLQSGDSGYLVGRATLGDAGAQEVSILLDGSTATFAAGAWNAAVPEMAIFDSQFITDNIFAGDHVDTDHKKNLYRIIVGARGVELARQIDDLDGSIRANNTDLRDGRSEVQRSIPTGITLEDFLVLPIEPEVDAKISSKQRELEAAKQADQIRQRGNINRLVLPQLPEGYMGLLQKTLEGVAADSEKQISDHLARHPMKEKGENWLSEGLNYIMGDECPFCAQTTKGLALISAYQAFFSAAYNSLRVEISGQATKVAADFGDRIASGISSASAQNSGHAEFWGRYCTISLPAVDAGGLEAVVVGLRQAALALIEKKSRTPLEKIEPDDIFTAAAAAFQRAVQTVAAYNAAVDAANLVIAAKKAAAAGANVGTIETELRLLTAKKARHDAQISASCQRYSAKVLEKAALEQQKEAARALLDQHTGQVITRYEAAINVYLDRFNAGFVIGRTTHNYRGGTPSSSYQLIINRRSVDLGDPSTPLNQPSFKNTLSGGDKSALAVAFFLAQLDHDPEKARKIVVFDDPFTSQDRFRRLATALQIRRCGNECAQVVVLSHEPIFLKEVWDNLPVAQRKTLHLARVADENTLIREWDIEDALRDHYRSDIEALQKYCVSGEGDVRQLVRRIRPVVEGYCRRTHPVDFDRQVTLGAIITRIRTVGAEHPLHVLLDELTELNVYSRRYHHPEGEAEAPAEPIDATELTGYSRKALRIAGCL